VALTGYGMDTDVTAAKAAGFDAHLTKPVDPDLIEGALEPKLLRRTEVKRGQC